MIYIYIIGLLLLFFGFCYWIYDNAKILKELRDEDFYDEL